MSDVILTLNAGSSSVKFSAFLGVPRPEPILRGQIDGLPNSARFRALDPKGQVVAEKTWADGAALVHAAAIDFLLGWIRSEGVAGRRLVAAGHRVVHGGARFSRPALVDVAVMDALHALCALAPLHQPHNLAAIAAISRIAPELPQVACFDTAFHGTQTPLAQAFAIPRRFTEAGVRRYGFHGLSYEHISGELPAIDPAAAAGRTIVAHLGNGASLCALRAGKSVATTMGFTAMDGLVMGTRCGAIDPGVLLYLARHAGLGMDELERTLYEQSGLLGVSGISGDMRVLLASEDPRAREAIDLFVYRIVRETGSLVAALGGLDSIVFTGGIGENAAPVRAAVCSALGWLGVDVDRAANERGGPRISPAGGRVSVWVIPANEEIMIARHTMGVLGGGCGQSE